MLEPQVVCSISCYGEFSLVTKLSDHMTDEVAVVF